MCFLHFHVDKSFKLFYSIPNHPKKMFSRNFFTVGKPKMFEILFVEIKNYYQPLYRNRTK